MESLGRVITGEKDAISQIVKGINDTVEVVASTYGPNGRNVIIEDEDGNPHITKDGVTVAKSITFSDPYINLGASLVKDASIRTLKEVGDGTTTTAILTSIAAREGLNIVRSENLNPFILRSHLDQYVSELIEIIKEHSTKIEDKKELLKVALNSANGDIDIASKVTDLFYQVGKDGLIFVRDSSTLGVHPQIIKGISISKGYVSPYFCNNGQTSVTLDKCSILISQKAIRNYKELIPFLQTAIQNDTPLLLVVPEIDNSITELFLTNIHRSSFRGCIIQAPYSHERQAEFLQDLGIACGAIVNEGDLDSNYLLGAAGRVVVSQDSTEFQDLSHNEEAYKKHLNFLENLILSQRDKFIADKISERLAIFSGSIGYLNVGTASDVSNKELKDKLDDVIHSVKAALKEGVVLGGGVALKSAINELIYQESTITSILPPKEKGMALDLLKRICYEPIRILGNIGNKNTTDPTKVIYTALQNAISVAGMLFTSSYVITYEK